MFGITALNLPPSGHASVSRSHPDESMNQRAFRERYGPIGSVSDAPGPPRRRFNSRRHPWWQL